MQDFLRICLVKDPVLRPSSDELMSHPWITTDNGDHEQTAAREAFLDLLLEYRATKQVEPDNILIHSTIGGAVPDSSILQRSGGYVEEWMNQGLHLQL